MSIQDAPNLAGRGFLRRRIVHISEPTHIDNKLSVLQVITKPIPKRDREIFLSKVDSGDTGIKATAVSGCGRLSGTERDGSREGELSEGLLVRGSTY